MSGETITHSPRYIMIGGFLGAGKTTAIVHLGKFLHKQGYRVGLITNDQGRDLVDTVMLRSHGFVTEEISGGCFCCRFDSLADAAENLTKTARPDVFVAEPVGSCTDLVATVSYPLRRIYGDRFVVAPFSVLVDPIRAERALGLENGHRFSSKVLYIYRKQLEEAEIIAINKRDLLTPERLQRLKRSLREQFPARVIDISARQGTGLNHWFKQLLHERQSNRPAMDLDYDQYAEGEALLGWFNGSARIHAPRPWDANKLLRILADATHRQLSDQKVEIAHMKMTLSPTPSLGDVAVLNLVRSDTVPELSQALEGDITQGQLIINLRAEVDPEALLKCVKTALDDVRKGFTDLSAILEHEEHFRPGRPVPTHRFTTAEDRPRSGANAPLQG